MKIYLLLGLICLNTVFCQGWKRSEASDHARMIDFNENDLKDIPKELDWGNKDGVNYLTTVKNQHLPRYCGSCWAQAITSVLSDRLNIHKKGGVGTEWSVSPQMLVSCSRGKSKIPGDLWGCSGGEPIVAMQWMEDEKNFLMDESCMPYTATNGTCDQKWLCYDQIGSSRLPADMSRMRKYGFEKGSSANVTQYFDTMNPPENVDTIVAQNNQRMLAELQNGPIVCGISVPSELINWKGDEIYRKVGKGVIGHAISVVGYGTRDGVDFWKVRNSWGEYFGDDGYFFVARGKNVLQIETACVTGIAKVIMPKNIEETDVLVEEVITNRMLKKKEKIVKPKNEKKSYIVDHFRQVQKELTEVREYLPCLKRFANEPSPTGFRDYSNIDPNALPKEVDYTKFKATPTSQPQNVLTWTINQHRPVYCGSCYIQAAVGTLADRINIINTRNGDLGPHNRRTLSAQMILNCGIGSCQEGGSSNTVFNFIQQKGVSQFGCQVYTATSPNFYDRTCSQIQQCSTCWPDGSLDKSKCLAVDDYKLYGVKEWGVVSGATAMKAEIANNGPIQCGIMVTNEFYNTYKGGIYSEYRWKVEIDHAIAVVGYGYDEDSKTEYWVVRNSWGTMWGEDGYFRIKMYEDNLGIETMCAWATPDLDFKPQNGFVQQE